MAGDSRRGTVRATSPATILPSTIARRVDGSTARPMTASTPIALPAVSPTAPAPVMIGLAGIAVLTFFLAFFSSLGLWVPADMWRPLVLIGVVCSVALLVLHPSVYAALPLALNAGLAWVAWTSVWTPAAA